MKTGIEIIAEERQRQIDVEGYTSDHDNEHDSHELLFAAETYLMRPFMSVEAINSLWPFGKKSLKISPDDRIRELAKAGALIAAEIDRLHRIAK